MRKSITTTLCAVALLAMAVNAMAAPGELSPKWEGMTTVDMGPQPYFVIFKDANDFIAIWTPYAIDGTHCEGNCEEGDECDFHYFYKAACSTQGGNPSEWDAFLNGKVVYFSGNERAMRTDGNKFFYVDEFAGSWRAYATDKTGKSVTTSIIVFCEGAADEDYYGSFPDDPNNQAQALFLNIHFQGTGYGDGTVQSGSKTLSVKGGDLPGGGGAGNSSWFGYVRLQGLSGNKTNTFNIVSGNKEVIVGKAVVSLTDEYIVVDIFGIDAGAKDWKVWIGSESLAANMNQGKDGKNGYQPEVTGAYTVWIPRSFDVLSGKKVEWSFDIEDYLVTP